MKIDDQDKIISINKIKVKLSHLDKVFFPDDGYTKGDLIDYYAAVSKFILPYLKDRPESLNRYPNGIYGESFYQKNMPDLHPKWVKTKLIYSDSHKKEIHYFVCNDKASLLYMINLGCIEINPWFSRINNLGFPDYSVIDLDPEDVSFDKVIETAQVVKEVLDEVGAKGFCKTSGATGMHVYIPLNARYNYDISEKFALLIAKIVHKKIPNFTSLERSPGKRKGKVYLDYLQNRAGQTLVAPYSVRPRPKATVSTPLAWEELKKGLRPQQFTIKNLIERLKKKGDIFKPVLGASVNIEKCIKILESNIDVS